MKRGREKYEELDAHLGDLGQIKVGGSEISSRSVYFAVCHRDVFDSQTGSGCPLYKVDVALSNSDSEDSEDSLEPSDRVKPRRIATLDTDIIGKTFISMESSGWIIGIGGNYGSTIIFDTKDNKVIHGPKLICSKWCPVVAAVGKKIYALSSEPDFLEEPDFVPWFEVLDLSKATITETEDKVSILDACSWEALPYPLCFPSKLNPTEYQCPPFILVRSYVVVEPYILISLNGSTNCVYAFDTNTGKWHMIDDEYLPFFGAATQLGHGSSIFLASSWENGLINAYDIHVSSASSLKNISSVADKGGALKLSITVFSIRNKKYGEDGCAKKAGIITSLGKKHFCELISFEGSGRYLVYDTETKESYPGKLHLQLCTYQTESRALQGETSEIVVSGQQELKSRVRSSRGFSSAPIAFALSI